MHQKKKIQTCTKYSLRVRTSPLAISVQSQLPKRKTKQNKVILGSIILIELEVKNRNKSIDT